MTLLGHPFFPCLLAGFALPAQQVSITAAMVAPWTATVQLGSQTVTGTGGTVPSLESTFIDLGAGGFSYAILESASYQYLGAAQFFLQHQLQVAAGGFLPATASASTEVLLQIAATLPITVELQLYGAASGSGGGMLPLVDFDIDNDGSIEATGWTAWTGTVVSLIPGQPKLVRVRVQTALVTTGALFQYVNVVVVPHNQTAVSFAAAGCSDYFSLDFDVAPTFSGDLELVPWSITPDPMVLVFGLGLQPAILPASVPLPCLLLPAPDILMAVWSTTLPPGAYVLPLPASVRPVTFWAQAVSVSPLGLPVTDAWRVDAL